MTVNVFAVPIFFICFRECLESSIIVSVLLSFIKQTLGPEQDPVIYKKLTRQVWWGVILGLALCLCIGAGLIGAYYAFGKDHFSAIEDIWEGVFGILASIVISIMGLVLLRVSKLQDKWRVKLAKALEAKDQQKGLTKGRFKRWMEKYSMFFLPFITVLREGLEAVVFIAGVSLQLPATSYPLAVVCGLAAGALVGYVLYRGGNMANLQMFLIASTCFLYLISAGLLSKGVWAFQTNSWNHVVGGDAAAVGSGPGSYDIRQSVWHVNCCNAEVNSNGGWEIFNAILGWENSATYGSVISYNLYWVVIIGVFVSMRYKEKHGHWPLMKAKAKKGDHESSRDSGSLSSGSGSGSAGIIETSEKKASDEEPAVTAVREIEV